MLSTHKALVCLCACLLGCSPQPSNNPDPPALLNRTAEQTVAPVPTRSALPIVLFDSFHAHNFLDRGLIPGEHTYHRFTALRRAANLLTDRQVDVQELLVGPITPERLKGVRLIVLNLPSMDRPPWLTSEIDAVERFLRAGGGMIFITDHTNCYYHQYHLLPLWQRLGLIPTFETACERTAKNLLSPSGNGWLLIRDFEPHPVTEGVRYFGMQTGGRVVGESVIARTSSDAWADAGLSPLYGEGNPGLTGDLKYSDSEEQGAQGVILAKSIDRGRVVVVSDQNALGDAQISYADNWRLWLNACNWAGQLNLDTAPLSIDKRNAREPARSATTTSLDETPPFEQLIGSQPDRNAEPRLPTGSWQVECWEGLSKGDFHWGSGDAHDYYFFWCWLNRWCWASAHEGPSNPAPLGRTLFFANDIDLDEPRVQRRVEQVLKQNGKVILMASHPVERPSQAVDSDVGRPSQAVEKDSVGRLSQAVPTPSVPTAAGLANASGLDSESQPAAAFQPTSDEETWLNLQLSKITPPPEAQQLTESATWQSQPLIHAGMKIGGGEIVGITNPNALQNTNFTPPEISPNAGQAKWQRQLYHWLFEQP